MALVDNAWYVNYGDGSTTGYYAVAAWAALTTYDCGTLRRQLAAPAVGSERVFVVIIGHVASGASEPAWTLTRGAKTTDATITWQECTGIAGVNGDKTNTPTWNTVKNTAVTLGQVITDVAQTIYLICSTAGTAGNGAEPSWAAYTTAGATTADNTVTWTNLGVVGNFTGWQAPHARLANALAATWGQASNAFYVADNHAETQATAMTLTFPGASGTTYTGNTVYCVDHTVAVPPTTLATTGTITTTGASAIAIAGSFYMYGLTFNMGTGAGSSVFTVNNTSRGYECYDSCKFALKQSASPILLYNSGASEVIKNNCTIEYNSASANTVPRSLFLRWNNVTLTGTAPTTLFADNSTSGQVIVTASDLSLLAAGKTLVGALDNGGSYPWAFIDCKLGAGVVVATTPNFPGSIGADLVRCDSGATSYRTERYRSAGTQTVETTIIRTGGATDGTTPIAWKIVTTANAKWVISFESLPISIWNDSTSSITVTIYGIWGGGAVPNNDDIWIEAEYLGSSSTPQASFATSTKANNLAAGSAIASDSSTWGGSTTKFAMSVTFTPGMKGPINIVVKAAKASSTFYIDPRPAISGITVSKSEILAPGVYANELSPGGMLVHPGMSGGARG